MFSTKFRDTPSKKRVTSDNKYLKSIQVKDIKSIITDDCVLHLDCDSIPYFGASLQDDNYVIVTHLVSGREMVFKNKTEFKGGSNKEGVITQSSWLGSKNLEQQAKGKPEFTLDNFSIEQKKKLKSDKDSCMSGAISYMKEYLDSILLQSGCNSMICYLGGGLNHRHSELLPAIYKGNRVSQERPTLLSACREWVENNYHTIIVENEEVDDRVQREAYKGSLYFYEHKKYSAMLGGIDKDGLGLPCLNFCYMKKGPFWTNPNPWVVEDWEVTGGVGKIEMQEGKCRASSLLMIARQLCTIDSADNYSMYLHFPKDMHPKEKYSDAGFFKQFCILKTPKDVLQGIVNRYLITFPRGLKFVAHEGTIVDIDTLTWLEMIFSCVYMLRKPLGEETMKLWLDKYGVDYSALVGNNKEKVYPFKEEPLLREVVNSLRSEVRDLAELATPKKAEAKPLQIAKLENVVERLNKLEKQFNNLFAIEDK
jgi:hypothetical protein